MNILNQIGKLSKSDHYINKNDNQFIKNDNLIISKLSQGNKVTENDNKIMTKVKNHIKRTYFKENERTNF